MVDKTERITRRNRLETTCSTGLTTGQLHKLGLLVMQEIGSLVKAGEAAAVGLLDSVVMVVMLMRRNATQAAAAAHFHCSQPTVSRRAAAPGDQKVVMSPMPSRCSAARELPWSTAPSARVWGRNAIPYLYSGKARYPGMNVQIACNLKGDVAAIVTFVHGARHDAYAFEASGLKEILQIDGRRRTGADLGYIGVDGIGIVPFKRLSGAELLDWQREFNTIFSKIRATVEHAVRKVKTWRMLSRKAADIRRPIGKFENMLAAVTGRSIFFAEYSND